jgi:hypothetical protein
VPCEQGHAETGGLSSTVSDTGCRSSTASDTGSLAKDSPFNIYWCKLPHLTGEDHFQLRGSDGELWYSCSCCKPNIRNSCNDTSILGAQSPASGKIRVSSLDTPDLFIECTPNAVQFIAVINRKMSNLEYATGELGEWPNLSRTVVDGRLVHKGAPWIHFSSPDELAQDCKVGRNDVMLGKGESSFIWLGVPTICKDGSWFLQFPTIDDFIDTPLEDLIISNVARGHRVRNITQLQYYSIVKFVRQADDMGEFGQYNQWYRDHCSRAQLHRYPIQEPLVDTYCDGKAASSGYADGVPDAVAEELYRTGG